MIRVSCDAEGCQNYTAGLDYRDPAHHFAHPPKHYYIVQHGDYVHHFCSARCLLPWVHASLPVDAAYARMGELRADRSTV